MTTIVVTSILLVLASLFCCHGLTKEIVLKGDKIEDNSNFVVLAVRSKLTPTDYLISFVEPAIEILGIPNKLLDNKYIINKNAVVPPILYKTSTQIPDLNAGKRIIRLAKYTADGLLTNANITKSPRIYGNTVTSTPEFADVNYNCKLYNVLNILSTSPNYATIRKNSNEIKKKLHFIQPFLDEYIKFQEKQFSSVVIYFIVHLYKSTLHEKIVMFLEKQHFTGMIDTLLNGVSNFKSYILIIENQIIDKLNGVSEWASCLMIKQHIMDRLPTIGYALIVGVFCGILIFVAVKAYQLRKARRAEVNQLPENILMYSV